MKRKINYTHIAEPTVFENVFPTYLTNETMMARKRKYYNEWKQKNSIN